MQSRALVFVVATATVVILTCAPFWRLWASELVHRHGAFDVPVNGGRAVVMFWGQTNKQVIGLLQIDASGDLPKNYSFSPYDWSVHLNVPRGGLLEFTNPLDFVAPDSGYQQSIEIHMRKDQLCWSDTVNKFYFVKLRHGYLRMDLEMKARTPLYTTLDYYYNPDGSRNLQPQ